MALIVCVETAAPSIMVALGDGKRVLYEESPATGRIEGPVFLHDAVCRGLDSIGSKARNIDAVAVDLGPGSLTATRGGVAFANALAWGLTKPLLPLDYFDLVARETGTTSTVVCVRPTTAGKGFQAERSGSQRGPLMVDDLARLARHCFASHEDFVLAGVVTAEVAVLFPGVRVGARTASSSTLMCLAGEAFVEGRHSFEPLEPLTTRSASVVSLSGDNGDG